MARFAVVAPCNIVETLKARKVYGNTHLLLAHDVVNKPKQYHELYAPVNMGRKLNDQERLVILDTSVVELGEAVDIDMMLEAIAISQPTVVVLPDVLYNLEATKKCVEDALFQYSKVNLTDFDVELMLCVQGASFEEYIRSAETFMHEERITWWGVPRDALKCMDSRYKLVKTLHHLDPSKKIHLLGFSDDHVDDMLCANLPFVTSIDSAAPLRIQKPISLIEKTPPRDPDWWENAPYHTIIRQNLGTVRKWFNDPTLNIVGV